MKRTSNVRAVTRSLELTFDLCEWPEISRRGITGYLTLVNGQRIYQLGI
jgi:hypothetical protein